MSRITAYSTPRRLTELELGKHELRVSTVSTKETAPKQGEFVHSQRLGARSLHAKTETAMGEKPVPLPFPLADGKLQRPPQALPFWAVREDFNLPFLKPGQYFTPQDLLDFQVDKRSPTIASAVNEIERFVPNLNQPPTGPLSPFAKMLLGGIVGEEKRAPFPHLPGGSTRGLAQSGAVIHALTGLFQQLAVNNVVSAQTVLEKLGAGGGNALLSAIREAVPDQRGLQQVLHRSQLPMEPTDSDVPLTREEAAQIRAQAPQLLDAMVAAAPIPKSLPAIDAALSLIPDGAFDGVHCVAVQHLLATNDTMFMALEKKGLDPRRTEVIGVPYSTNFVVEHDLRSRGYAIDTPDVVDPNDVAAAYEAAIKPALERAIAAALKDGKPILLLDDGGKLTTYVAKHYPEAAKLFVAVEQTTRGLTELAALPSVPMPVVNVAKSPLKKLEGQHIGEQVVKASEHLASQIGLGGLTAKPSLVMGFGPIGESIALALKASHSNVTVWDPDPEQRQRAREAGFDVPEKREDALKDKALIVGGSGHRSITREDLKLMSPETVLASASSRDIELDLSANHDEQVEVVPVLAAGRGDRRFATRVWRFEDKDIVVLRNGFPLNFDGNFETGSNEDIAYTRGAMVLAAFQALQEKTPGLKAANVDLQGRLAKKMGIELPQ